MKIAITKIGANISFGERNTSAACADILYALRTMKGPDVEFNICTTLKKSTVLPKSLNPKSIFDLRSFDDFDCVLVFNGRINFFGGAEDKSLIKLYSLLHHTKKPIFYVQTDGALPFLNLWQFIYKRAWAEPYSEEEFSIDGNNVTYLTQGRNIPVMERSIRSLGPKGIQPKKVVHIPWETTILSNWEKHFKTDNFKDPSERKFDLGFGGYVRNTHKRNKIEEYYDDPELNTLLFGNLRDVRLKNTKISSSGVPFQNMVPMMSQCKASVIIGDKFYEDNFHTLRMYECILAGCVVLIDRDLDKEAKFYDGLIRKNEFLVKNIVDVKNFLKDNDLDNVASWLRLYILESFDREKLRGYIYESING